jgi:hypothetical protein
MARGWESKAVEAQQDEASRSDRAPSHRPLTGGEMERLARRRSLELARARAQADLRAARNPVHREMLQRTLAALDAQLAE